MKKIYRESGFTLVELAIVLVVIGLLLGALGIAKDLQRSAVYQQLNTAFVQGWAQAYQLYFDRTGIVLGDSTSTPTYRINQGGAEICGADLHDAMDAAGVRMPSGRAEGSEDRFVYLDSNGIPQSAQACFANVSWSVPSATAGAYVARTRNVLVLKFLTPDLARSLDASIDGKPDARFGRFRENTQAGMTGDVSVIWSVDNRSAYGTTSAANLDESQVAVVTAYYLMDA